MDLGGRDDSEARFASYIEGLARVIGHADRVGPLRDYCTGLMLPGERKSVEPMAARTAPARTAAGIEFTSATVSVQTVGGQVDQAAAAGAAASAAITH